MPRMIWGHDWRLVECRRWPEFNDSVVWVALPGVLPRRRLIAEGNVSWIGLSETSRINKILRTK